MDGEIMGRTRRRKSTCRVAFAERGVQGGSNQIVKIKLVLWRNRVKKKKTMEIIFDVTSSNSE
jgi:hypothetical protein